MYITVTHNKLLLNSSIDHHQALKQNLEHKYVCIELFRNLWYLTNISTFYASLCFKLCVLLLVMVY